MSLLGTIWSYISTGHVFGLPTLAFMAIPFVIGVVLGLLIKKALKMAILIAVIVALLTYLGILTVNIADLESFFYTYGSQAAMYAAMVIAILPLGTGFIIGLIIAFTVM